MYFCSLKLQKKLQKFAAFFLCLFYFASFGNIINAESKFSLWPASSFKINANEKAFQLEGKFKVIINKKVEFSLVEDRFNLMQISSEKIQDFPELNFNFFTTKQYLIPVNRGVHKTSNSYWEYLVEPGLITRVDHDWSRAVLPFALSEKNGNCLHNGLIDFLFNAQGQTKNTRLQIAAETCADLKFNLQIQPEISFKKQSVKNKNHLSEQFSKELSSRLPIRPIKDISEYNPLLKLKDLTPADEQNFSVFGLSIDDQHFISECKTRSGDYPYCSHFALPSFSLAKTIIIGMSYLSLLNHDESFSNFRVSKYLPECKNKAWKDVTISALVNMKSGFYISKSYIEDEYAPITSPFFESSNFKDKLEIACNLYPYQESSGQSFVYHTSDHFLAGVVMTRFLRHKTGNNIFDLYDDLIYKQILIPLGVSPLLQKTKRTQGEEASPFFGYGLIFLLDDLLKINHYFNQLQQHSSGININTDIVKSMFGKRNIEAVPTHPFAYQTTLWLYDLKKSGICKNNSWLHFMSGYGGISNLLFPNNMRYFSFTDGHNPKWGRVAKTLNSIYPYCE